MKNKCKHFFVFQFLLVFILSKNLVSCATSKDSASKPLTEAQLHKKLEKERKKQNEIARKANERAKKEFWDKQSRQTKNRIKETNKRDKRRLRLFNYQNRRKL